MRHKKTTAMVVALALALALAVPGVGAAAPLDQTAGTPAALPAAPRPLFDPQGPDGLPGAWLQSSQEGYWTWLPARVWTGDVDAFPATAEDGSPPWPADAAVFWVAPAGEAGQYWVWDVFNFAWSDVGPSHWAPRWRLLSGVSTLGR